MLLYCVLFYLQINTPPSPIVMTLFIMIGTSCVRRKQQDQIVDSFIKNVNALFYVLDDSRNGHERDYTSQIASITTNQISISIGHHWLEM